MRKFIKYIFIVLIQQMTLNSYSAESKEYQSQIDTANDKQLELNNTIKDLNSTDYIESQAREKLDMYMPNERVYIDITK